MNMPLNEALEILSKVTQPQAYVQMTRADYFNAHVAILSLDSAVKELEKTRDELQQAKAELAKVQITQEADGSAPAQ